MHRPGFIIAALLVLCAVFLFARRHTIAADIESKGKVHRDTGIEKRVLWTTSRIQGKPGPPDAYTTEVAFPTVRFEEPLAMAVVPGSNRFGIAERHGKIYTFQNDPDTASKELLLELDRTLYGLAFHPRFAENGYFYVTSITAEDHPTGSRLSRFTAKSRSPLQADPASEIVLMEWLSGGHNGGCLRFGPDGYLYMVAGDGSGIADQHKTGQDLSDILASMLRIDVDHATDGRPYAIPPDNPFVDVEGVRGEIWAYGLRQAWKFSFDTANGNLWAGEVGQDLWEMIHLIEKGGNYGWSVNEGRHPFRPTRTKGPTPMIGPIIEHNHDHFRSITGGYVYHSDRLPDLNGDYVYGDYDTGKIWALHYDENGKLSRHRQLADTQLRLVEFGQDADGEILLVDFVSGTIQRLDPAPPPSKDAPTFPQKLSETGLFASTRGHLPAPGLIPYTVHSPLWSDHASKDRFLALPGDSKIEFDAVIYPQPAPGAPAGWRFPDGTVLVKTFSLEMQKGNPATSRRLETRILHHERVPGDDDEYGAQVWHGYTYLWNDDQTDAELLGPDGLDRTYTVIDADAPGGKRTQKWHFPSRTECTLCHTMSAKYVLGVNTLQMNKDHDYGDVVANQLQTLDHLGIFTKPLPKPHEDLPKLGDYKDERLDLDRRARAYLHANCSHCHRKWGGGNAEFQLLATLPLAETGTVNTLPGQGRFGLKDPVILTPGNPSRSLVYHRMTIQGLGRMPHVASNVVDTAGVKLIREWIEQLPRKATSTK